MGYDSDVQYVFALLPIVISHLAIPPLSLLMGTERLEDLPPWLSSLVELFYQTVPPQLLSRRFVESLCCDMNSTRNQSVQDMIDSGDVSRLTYILVHADFSHMLSNLKAIVSFGYPVYNQMGQAGLLLVYLLGGVAAIWPSPLHNQSVTQRAEVIEDTLMDWIPEFARSALPDAVQKHARRASSYIANKALDMVPRIACGSSGAACALLGASLVFETHQLYRLLREIFPRDLKWARKHKSDGEERSLITPEQFWRMGQRVWYLASAVSYISTEVTMITLSREALFTLTKQYGFLSTFSISHSAHVQGCLFGLCIGLWNLTM